MADDLQAKLDVAARHFANRQLSEAAKILQACPQDDPKVRHNLAMVDFLRVGGNHNDVVETLSLTPSIVGTGWTRTDGHAYEGNEFAVFNKAVILLHCGAAEAAAALLEGLAANASLLPPALQLRVALLLQVATMPSGKAKHRTKAQEDAINAIITDKANQELVAGDEALRSMVDLAISDGSALHEWYRRPGARTPAEAAIYFNNLGVGAMNDGKPSVASLFLARAAKEAADAPVEATFAQAVMYNAGLCSLTLGNHAAAFECFKHCQATMSGSALLWVRIAQACVGLYASAAEEEATKAFAATHKGVSEAVLASAKMPSGAPFFAHLPLADGPALSATASAAASARKLTAVQSEHLATALKAIVSALQQLPTVADVKSKAVTLASQQGQTLQYSHILGAYVNLARGDPGAAFTHCQQLLQMHNSRESPLNADVHTAALNYAAEALCHMNRPELALKTLQASNLADLVAGGERAAPAQKAAVEALFVNLAIVHILNGSWKQAQNVVNAIVSKFVRTPGGVVSPAAKAAGILEVYLELALGNQDKALELLSGRPQALTA